MKVLSISHMFPNNINPNNGIFVKERIKYISKKIELKVVAPLPYFPMNHLLNKYGGTNKVKKKENFDTLSVYHPKYFCIPKFFKFLDGYFYYFSTNDFFYRSIDANNIDLLDFHWVYPDAFAGLKWAKRFNKKIVITIRGNESICYFEKSLRKKMLINTLKSVDHVIAVSTDMNDKVVNEYGIDEAKVTVISNGIDNQKFYVIDKDEARRLCNLELDKKYILSLGRLSHEKGLEYLFKAFSTLNNNDIILVVVGDGPLKGKLKKMAHDLNIADSIRFVGSVSHEDTYKWYNAADVYCLASLGEGCPNTIIESLACGTPVVSTQVGGIPDLVPTEDYGFLVHAGDEVSLSKALEKALNRDWDRSHIADFGRQNTWDQVADRVIEVFKKVLDGNF